jgi:predicted esterase
MVNIFDYQYVHKPYVIEPVHCHTHTVIILKGHFTPAGAFARYFCKLQASDERTLPKMFPTFKWVFPTTELWYDGDARYDDIWDAQMPKQRLELDIQGLETDQRETRAARMRRRNMRRNTGPRRKSTRQPRLKAEKRIIDTIVGIEASFVPASRIILGGHSQGCTTALWNSLLGGSYHLGGFIGLSGWLHSQTANRSMMRAPQDRKSIPVFLAHCEDDDMVPIENVSKLSSVLKRYGMYVEVHRYGTGGHGWPWFYRPETVDDVAAFLRRVAGDLNEAILFDNSEWKEALPNKDPGLVINSQLRGLAGRRPPSHNKISKRSYKQIKYDFRKMDLDN